MFLSRVPTAWVHSIWVWPLFIGFASLLVWLVSRLCVKGIDAALNARFNERLAEHTRVARDLQDTLLQTIEASRMVAEDALDPPADPVRMRRAMSRLSEWLVQATREGEEALNSLRTSTGDGSDLDASLRRVAEEQFLQHPMKFTLTVTGERRDIHPMVRGEVYQIGAEAIRNACRHFGASHLEVQLAYERNFSLRVRDDGRSIESRTGEDNRARGAALRAMQGHAERIGAKLSLIHSFDTGTELTLVVPAGIVFQRSSLRLSLLIGSVYRRLCSLKTRSGQVR